MSDDMMNLFNALDEQSGSKSREEYVRAPFGYPGSKSRSLEEILPKLPYTNKYVEVFGGSGAILLARRPSKLEVFNDRNAGVTALYRCVRDPVKLQKVLERLEHILHSREEFIWCRDTWQDCEDDVERAFRWYYMIQASFTSQGRNFGRVKNGFNQCSSKLKGNLPLFYPLHERLKFVTIENLDWRQCFDDYDDYNTVFYLDPPYLESCQSMYKDKFTRDHHIELCDRIKSAKGFVALSGYDNDIYARYKWDAKHTWETRITITAQAFDENNGQQHGTARSDKATECLWIKESK